MSALDRQIDAAERRLQARRDAWDADVTSVRRRIQDAASSPMALLSAVAVGFGLDRLRAGPQSRPASDQPAAAGPQPLVLLTDALNIASALLALHARSRSAAPPEQTSA